jgi:hypothetical protein
VTVLVVELHRQGILIGADRNITSEDAEGNVLGQLERRAKVLAWPDGRVIAEAAGLATVNGAWMDEWLADFALRHPETADSHAIARALRDELQEAIPPDVRAEKGIVIHLDAFEKRDGYWVPFVHYVHNVKNIKYEAQLDFVAREEVYFGPDRYGGVPSKEMRDRVGQRSDQLEPFWFHQTGRLPNFNMLLGFLNAAIQVIVSEKLQPYPHTIEERADHLRMKILTYGAYHEAFDPPHHQFVGGGVDVVALPWPED